MTLHRAGLQEFHPGHYPPDSYFAGLNRLEGSSPWGPSLGPAKPPGSGPKPAHLHIGGGAATDIAAATFSAVTESSKPVTLSSALGTGLETLTTLCPRAATSFSAN